MSHELRRCGRMGLSLICVLSLAWTVFAESSDEGWGTFPQSPADAARFLEYSTWGPNGHYINYVQEVWLS